MEEDGPGDEEPPGPDWAALFANVEDDTADYDDAPTAPYPLPPDDRLWRHPSELRYLEATPEAAPSTRRSSWRQLAIVGIGAGLIGATLAAGAFAFLVPRSTRVVERVVERQAVQTAFTDAAVLSSGDTVADIAEAVTPSVVRVEVYLGSQAIGSGSGVIFRDDGHLITNAHVVDDGDRIRVVMADGQFLNAELVGSDSLTDVAVVKIVDAPSAAFVPAALGSTAELRAGEPAIAIGSPLRLLGGPTVTVGVVSAVNRRLQSPNGDWLYDLVQTDAPIAPGSSGGALVDSRGSLVGITTVIAVTGVGAEGLGFATPVEIAHEVAQDIIAWGTAKHGLLGLRGEDANLAELRPTGRQTGVVVRELDAEGPAIRAGLQPGDIIVSLDFEPVGGMSDLVVDARLLEPGTIATVEIYRKGELQVLEVVVGELR